MDTFAEWWAAGSALVLGLIGTLVVPFAGIAGYRLARARHLAPP
jgi:hypothetical protein